MINQCETIFPPTPILNSRGYHPPPPPRHSAQLCLDTFTVSRRSDTPNQIMVIVQSHLNDTSPYGPHFLNKYNQTAPPPLSRYHNFSVLSFQAIRHSFSRQTGNNQNGKFVSMSTPVRTLTARFPGPTAGCHPVYIVPPGGPPEGLA